MSSPRDTGTVIDRLTSTLRHCPIDDDVAAAGGVGTVTMGWTRISTGLYRMNRRGRADPSPGHQVNLLASVSDNLDCLHLQYREFGFLLLKEAL
jgi:hypothetical protein